MMLSALALALSMVVTGPSDHAPARYELDLSLMRDGEPAVLAKTIIVEDGTANVTINDASGTFEMNASLNPVQGDADVDALSLYVTINDGDAQPQEPHLLIKRGQTARVVIGQEGPDGKMSESLTLTLTPIQTGD